MQRGYNAFSYHHIATELGVKNAAVHYHFRTKTELVSAVLDRYHRQFLRWTESIEDLSPKEQLDSYIQVSRTFLEQQRICALGMMATEFNAIPEEVQAETERVQNEIFGWYTQLLARGREAGVFRFPGTAEDKASEVACTMLGAQQLGRVRGHAAFNAVAGQVRLSLGLSTGQSTAARVSTT